MSTKYKISVIAVVLLFVLGFDQITKYWAVNYLMNQMPHIYLNGIFQFVYAENPGAFLGLGGDWSREVRFVIFAFVVFVGLGGMLWYLIKKENLKLNLYAYTFIMAGGFGNLWDRFFHEDGHVIDFMLIEVWGPIKTGVFNVADVFIVIGVIMAIFGDILLKKISKRDGV